MIFTTVVNKKYQNYVPWFCLFVKHTYPKDKVIIFSNERLDKTIIDQVSVIDKNYVIDGNYFSRFSNLQGQELKSLRWLINMKDAQVYIGDIDIMICPEPEDLLIAHETHCEDEGLPYSNEVRPGTQRLTGLQYCQPEYFTRIREQQTALFNFLKGGSKLIKRNEEVLFEMVVASGMGLPRKQFRPHHGLHLGLWRKGHVISPEQEKEMQSHGYQAFYEFYKQFKQSPEFVALQTELPLQEFKDMEFYFEVLKS